MKLTCSLVWLAACWTCLAATLTVVNNSDSGAGSLRQAILDANGTPGTNVIEFNIPGTGVQTISPFHQLPVITNAVSIDGTTQPGYIGSPLIALSGSSVFAPASGLVITSGGTTVRALTIRSFKYNPGASHGIVLAGSGGNVVAGCLIGTDATGTAQQYNSGEGIWISNSVNNVIGGTALSDRNVISGNVNNGILISGSGSTGNQVMGNYIGLDLSGTNAIANSNDGILISNAPNNIIGGITSGARNVISGQSYNHGLVITGTGATGNLVQGNFIGTTASGMTAVITSPNYDGISLNNASSNTIGGTLSGARNIISGNYNGISLIGSNTTGNIIQGNFIGTDVSGSNKIQNYQGIAAEPINGGSGARSNTIGGAMSGAGNVISGNKSYGVFLNLSAGNVVQGNYVGPDATGMMALGNGISGGGGGISVAGSGNLIGGTLPGSGNVISGNTSDGLDIIVASQTDFSVNNLVEGNLIGVAVDGVSPLGNGVVGVGGRGISVLGANNNTIGGLVPGSANLIGYNGLDGIFLAGAFGFFGTAGSNNLIIGNTIVSNGLVSVANSAIAAGVTLLGPNQICSNSIYGNAGLGIDAGGDGPTANTPNGPSNYPVLALAHQGTTDVDGTLNAGKNCVYVIQFFDNPENDPRVQARDILGQIEVTTDGSGNATFHFSCAYTVPLGDRITATATAKCPGNPAETSEISQFTIVFKLDSTSPAGPGTYANHNMSGTDNDPISLFNGELFNQLPPDLALGGPLPLVFERYYAAFLKKDGLIAGKLGDNWLHNFEMTLATTPSNTVNIVNNQGRLIPFTNSAGVFILLGRQDVPFQLATNGSNYVLGDPDSQMLYTFDPTGKLTSIADGHGNAQMLAYSGTQLTTVSDGLGRTLTFQYSGSGFLTNVSDGTRSVGFVQTGNNLTGASDVLGFAATYNYDSANPLSGLLTAATEPEGNIPYSQTFNTNGQVLTQTEAGINTTSFIYSNNTTTMVDPIGHVRQNVHSNTGELAGFIDETGLKVTIGSNQAGQRSAVTDRLGRTAFMGYHASSGGLAMLTNSDGNITSLSYSSRAASGITFYDISGITYPDGTSESLSYDASGNVLTHTDRAGKVFSFSYNNRGQALTATNPLGGVATFTYDVLGRLATRTDSDTGLTTFQYDSLDRLTNVIHPDGTSLQSTFDLNSRLVSIKDERTNTTTFAYDRNNRLISMTDASLQVTHFAYDRANRVVQVTDRLGRSVAFDYDTLDHVTAVTNRNGYVTTLTYDARRRLATLTDPGGRVWGLGYDNESFLLSASNPLGETHAQSLNSEGNAITFTNALGQVASLARDSMQRITNAVDEIKRVEGYGYDARGLMASSTAPLIGKAAYQYNNLGLLSSITDLSGRLWSFGYTPMGRPQSITDPLNRSSQFAYDTRGRLKLTTFADGVVRTNSYDGVGNPIRRQYSSGPDLQYTYDSLDRLATAGDLSLAYDAEGRVTNTVSSSVNQGAAYDADGRLVSVSYNNGAVTVAFLYDSRDQLIQVSDNLTSAQINFAYDDAGRLTNTTRANGVNGSYTYDAADRLTRIQEGSIIDLQYTIDPAGEVTMVSFNAPLDPASYANPNLNGFKYDAAQQISNSGYGYDARGRLVMSPGHTFCWDGAARLTCVDGVTLGYNGLSDIVTRTVGGTTTRYFYNLALGLKPIVVEKNDTTGAVQRYYVWSPGGRLLYLIDAANGNAVYYFHFERVGSTLALTSGTGTVTDAYSYSPYGVVLGHTGTNPQPFTYIGKFGVRAEGALFHMRTRYYDPLSARFLSRDPLGTKLQDVRSLDPYQYAAENPLTYIDPLGLDKIDFFDRDQGEMDTIDVFVSMAIDMRTDLRRESFEAKENAAIKASNQARRMALTKKQSEWYEEKWRAQEEARVELNDKLRDEYHYAATPEEDPFRAAAEVLFYDQSGMINEEIQGDLYVENHFEYFVAHGMSSGEAHFRAREALRAKLENREFGILRNPGRSGSKSWEDAHIAIKYYNQRCEAIRKSKLDATHNASTMGRAGVNPTAANTPTGGEVRVVNGVKLEYRLTEWRDDW